MATDAAPTDEEPLRPVDVVYEDARTLMTRVLVGGRTVIRRQPLAPDAPRRVRHETAMLARLRGVPWTAQLLADGPAESDALILAEPTGMSLAALHLPLPV